MDWSPVLVTSGAIGAVGLACGTALAMAARFLAVREDPRIAEIEALLPGVNCGGCGYAGCADYAKAVAAGAAAIDLCAPGGPDTLHALAAATGQEAAAGERMVAMVLCQGDETRARHKHLYNGLADCSAAALVAGGDMACSYGCLGYGSCAFVCPSGAIEISRNLAIVHPDLCIGCRKCVSACPRSIIHMVPASRGIHVLCSSKDKGPVAKKTCAVACIGCRLCVKFGGEAFEMDGFLARRNYAIPVASEEAIAKCPGKCIVRTDAREAVVPAAAGTAEAGTAAKPAGGGEA